MAGAKWRIGLDLIDGVRTWGLEDQPVVADAGYGRVSEFRDELAQRLLRYVLAVDEGMGCWLGDVPAIRRRHKTTGRPLTSYEYGDHRPLS